jgi:ComF family protein
MKPADLLHVLLEQDCLLCAAAGGTQLICAPCVADMQRADEGCPRCADAGPAEQVCGACLKHPPHFDSTTALWRYEFPLDRLVLALKYGERLALAAWFGRVLAREVNAKPDLLLPMPLHPTRLRQRGFNQAAEIARAVAKRLKLTWKSDVLVRLRDTAPQADLPIDERARNVREAFLCMADLSGKTVALIDDVMTTGATLNEAAVALKRAGAARVENWVVARAVLQA